MNDRKMVIRSSKRIDFASIPAKIRVASLVRSRTAKAIIAAADAPLVSHDLAAIKAAARARGGLIVDRNGRVL